MHRDGVRVTEYVLDTVHQKTCLNNGVCVENSFPGLLLSLLAGIHWNQLPTR